MDVASTPAHAQVDLGGIDVDMCSKIVQQTLYLHAFFQSSLLQTLIYQMNALGGLQKFAAAFGHRSQTCNSKKMELSPYLASILNPGTDRDAFGLDAHRQDIITVGVVGQMVSHDYCKDPIAMQDATAKIRNGTHDPSPQFRVFLEQLCADVRREAGEAPDSHFMRQVARANMWAQNHAKVVTKELKKSGQEYKSSPLYIDAIRPLHSAAATPAATSASYVSEHNGAVDPTASWMHSLHAWNASSYANPWWSNLEVQAVFSLRLCELLH